jgi:hypothetical protein
VLASRAMVASTGSGGRWLTIRRGPRPGPRRPGAAGLRGWGTHAAHSDRKAARRVLAVATVWPTIARGPALFALPERSDSHGPEAAILLDADTISCDPPSVVGCPRCCTNA